MGIQEISALIFIIFLIGFLYLNRKKLTFQSFLFPLFYIAMYRTSIGLKLMDTIAEKGRRLLNPLCYVIIMTGFAGMALILFELGKSAYNILSGSGTASGVGIVQPFFSDVPGTVFVPFFYFMISIFVIATVHEFSHGVIARLHNVKVKSSGLAIAGFFLPIIPAAFVEPDEKKLKKKSLFHQLSLYAAGPFANIMTAFGVLAVIAFLITPMSGAMFEFNGLEIKEFSENSASQAAGVQRNEIIRGLDGTMLTSREEFSAILSEKEPGETVQMITDQSAYRFGIGANPEDPAKAYLGVIVSPKMKYRASFVNTYGEITADVLSWTFQLFFWLFILNLGIGLFNLVPIGPIDGGRMIFVLCQKYFKEPHALSIASCVSLCVLLLLFFNLFSAFLGG